MRRSASAFSLFVLLLNMSFSAVAATNHTVKVGGSGLTFTPSSLTITAGDTVTFTNAGGFHNVVANDGAFRCADNCTATGGNANSSAWSSVVTYNSAGTFGYYCEIHGGPGAGMHGSIIVEAAPPPPPTGPGMGGYMSGNWYNPAQSGSGFQLEVTSSFGQMLAVWFVYKPDGSGQQWIFAQGTYDSTISTVTLPALLIQNGKFPFPLSNYVASDIQKTSWGTVTFTFSDCNTGVASWDSTLPGYGSGSVPITRLTQIAGTVCP